MKHIIIKTKTKRGLKAAKSMKKKFSDRRNYDVYFKDDDLWLIAKSKSQLNMIGRDIKAVRGLVMVAMAANGATKMKDFEVQVE